MIFCRFTARKWMSTSSDRKQGGHKLFDAWGRNLAIMSPSSTSGPAWGKYQLPTNYLSFGESWLPWELIARQWSRRVNKEQGGRLYNNNNNNNNIARSQLVEVDARNQNEQWSYLGRCTHPPHTDRWPVSDHWWCILVCGQSCYRMVSANFLPNGSSSGNGAWALDVVAGVNCAAHHNAKSNFNFVRRCPASTHARTFQLRCHFWLWQLYHLV